MTDDSLGTRPPENTGEVKPPDNSPNAGQTEAAADNVPDMSLEEVDLFIADADPAFAARLKEIGQDTELRIDEPQLSEAELEFLREKEKWDKAKGLKKLIYKFLPSVIQLSLRVQKVKFQFYARIQAEKVKLINWLIVQKERLKAGLLRFLIWLRAHTIGLISDGIKTFKAFDKKKKIIFSISSLTAAVALVVLTISWTRGIIPDETDLFYYSLDEISGQSFDTSSDEQEPFYENIRTGLHLFHIEKLVVNIRPSASSGSNPMAAFDFFIESNSPEVLAEIKSREVQFRDQFQRTMEQYSFDQLDSVEGKKELTQTLERELNAVLTAGRIRAVRIKTAVLKP